MPPSQAQWVFIYLFHPQVSVSANRFCFPQLARVRDKHGAVLPCAFLPHMRTGQWLPVWAGQPCQWENLTFFYVTLAFWECKHVLQALCLRQLFPGGPRGLLCMQPSVASPLQP